MSTDVMRWRDAEEFKSHVSAWAGRIGVEPSRVQVQRMTRKWASCSSNGVLSFNTELLEKEREFGEAVIVHELLHLRIPNHGRLFRSLFRAYLPDVDAEAFGIASCGSPQSKAVT
jgi:predicted metal-dependent hydrolase